MRRLSLPLPLALLTVLPIAGAAAQAPAATSAATGAATSTPAVRPRAQASPRDTASGAVGGTTVSVDYGRPSKRGRTIFAADGLVPYGQVWRTGANAATTLTTSRDLMVGGTRVPAGKYTLYTIPQANGWQLVINKQTGQWGTTYDEKQDLARVPMRTTTLAAPVEQFTIVVEPAALVLRWDTVEARTALKAAGAK